MNGYASANVAATVDGLKVLFHADACKSVHVSPQVLIDAPYTLTASGLGDVLAKSVSSADWKMNQYLFGEYYCQFSVDLLKDLEPIYLDNPTDIKNKDPQAIQALFEALFYSSIAMTITGTSSPASGGEHLISHTLDMTANRDHTLHDLHGRQVGVASILMGALYERVMNIDKPVFHEPPASIDTPFWGSLSAVVEKEYSKKKVKFDLAANRLSSESNWRELQNTIKPGLVPPQKLKNCLARADAAHRYSDILDHGQPLQREKFLKVVLNANQMRERFTILDLAILLGVLPGELGDLVGNWVS
jgi:glycerol-1-phosphate dehydrogenase [NAD(P)+]